MDVKASSSGRNGYGVERESAFSESESPALAPLPVTPFEPSEWVYGRKVSPDFHVAFKINRYSVAYALVGRKIGLRVTPSEVEVFLPGRAHGDQSPPSQRPEILL